MRARSVAIGLLVMFAVGVLAPAADAANGTSLDCPGVIATSVGYRLTQDVERCDIDFFGATEDGTVLDLGGYTFTGGFYPSGDHQTLRNGTLVITEMNLWDQASNFTVSHVTVRPPEPGGCLSFCIEAGDDLTIEHSTFQDIGGIALDFYYGGDATIRHTDFLRNRIGISIQLGSRLTIENNRFIGNGAGLNLWPEDGAGVNDITIRTNQFRQNKWGLQMTARDLDGFDSRLLSGNEVSDNRFAQNLGSGMLIDVHCFQASPYYACDLPTDNFIAANHFSQNGEAPADLWQNGNTPAHPYQFADDGLSARGFLNPDDGSPPTDFPEALAGFQLARNRAHHNADLGFDVPGVTDWRGNRAWRNGNPLQCLGIACLPKPNPLAGISWGSSNAGASLSGAAPPAQLEHAAGSEAPEHSRGRRRASGGRGTTRRS